MPAVLPAALDLERARVQDGEAAGAVAVGVAEHADDDVLAGHAVHGVRARQPGRADDLVGLDHLLDPRPPRVVGDVDDVDPRGTEAGHDQMRAVGPVAGRAAAVPAEVVQLVADVGHRRLVHDPAVLGIDHRQEVRPLHRRALVQAGEVQELLRLRADAPLLATRKTRRGCSAGWARSSRASFRFRFRSVPGARPRGDQRDALDLVGAAGVERPLGREAVVVGP